MLLVSMQRAAKRIAKGEDASLHDTFPQVITSGKNDKGEAYTGLAEQIGMSRDVLGKALHEFNVSGQIRQCERYDERSGKTHYDYSIAPDYITNEHPITHKKTYTPREAKKTLEKTVDVTHSCLSVNCLTLISSVATAEHKRAWVSCILARMYPHKRLK